MQGASFCRSHFWRVTFRSGKISMRGRGAGPAGAIFGVWGRAKLQGASFCRSHFWRVTFRTRNDQHARQGGGPAGAISEFGGASFCKSHFGGGCREVPFRAGKDQHARQGGWSCRSHFWSLGAGQNAGGFFLQEPVLEGDSFFAISSLCRMGASPVQYIQ